MERKIDRDSEEYLEALRAAIKENGIRIENSSCAECMFLETHDIDGINDVNRIEGLCRLNPPERTATDDEEGRGPRQYSPIYVYGWDTCSKFKRLPTLIYPVKQEVIRHVHNNQNQNAGFEETIANLRKELDRKNNHIQFLGLINQDLREVNHDEDNQNQNVAGIAPS